MTAFWQTVAELAEMLGVEKIPHTGQSVPRPCEWTIEARAAFNTTFYSEDLRLWET